MALVLIGTSSLVKLQVILTRIIIFKNNNMRSLFFVCFLAIVLCLPLSLNSNIFELNSALAVNNTHSYTNPLTVTSFSGWFGNLLVQIQGIVGWLAVVMIIIGGLVYVTSGGSPAQTAKGKAIVLTSLIGFAVAVAAPSLLKEVKDIATLGAGGGPPTAISGAKTIQEIVTDVMQFLLVLVGVSSVISFIIGGIMYITSGGDQTKADSGKRVVTYSIIAVCVSGASLMIIKQVLALLS